MRRLTTITDRRHTDISEYAPLCSNSGGLEACGRHSDTFGCSALSKVVVCLVAVHEYGRILREFLPLDEATSATAAIIMWDEQTGGWKRFEAN